MNANEQLDYLISALQSLLDGKDIDIDKFCAVCRDKEARAELKSVIEAEEKV